MWSFFVLNFSHKFLDFIQNSTQLLWINVIFLVLSSKLNQFDTINVFDISHCFFFFFFLFTVPILTDLKASLIHHAKQPVNQCTKSLGWFHLSLRFTPWKKKIAFKTSWPNFSSGIRPESPPYLITKHLLIYSIFSEVHVSQILGHLTLMLTHSISPTLCGRNMVRINIPVSLRYVHMNGAEQHAGSDLNLDLYFRQVID